MAEVQLREIEKQFSSKRILDRLSLTVPHGKYLVMLGPSGCGKTTLLKIIAGLIQADSGDVTIAGRDMKGVAPRQRDVAMVFQGDALYPHLTIAKSLEMGRNRNLPKAKWKAQLSDAIKIAGINEILNRKPEGLSGGELRRAAVAKAIARHNSVRLLDEPLSALDANVRHSIGQSLLQWHATNPGTTIHVTHDGQEAMRMADLIAVIDRGRVAQLASPSEIYKAPISQTVALAIGSPPMNFVSATYVDDQVRFDEAVITTTDPLRLHSNPVSTLQVGFRAEACQSISYAKANEPGMKLTGKVTRTEIVDGTLFAELCIGQQTAIVATDEPHAAGATIAMIVPIERLHVFDSANGQRIAVKNLKS